MLNFLTQAIAALSGLLSSILLIRWLGATQFGTYSFILSLIGIGGIISGLGFSTLLVRQTATWIETEDWTSIKGLLIFSVSLTIFAGILVAGMILWFGFHLDQFRMVRSFMDSLVIAVILMLFTTEAGLLTSILQGFSRVTLSLIPGNVGVPLLLLGGIIFWAVWHHKISTIVVLLIQVSLAMGLIVVQTWHVLRVFPKAYINSRPKWYPKIWFFEAIPFLFNGALTVINLRTDVFLIGVIKGPEAAGVYNAASRGAMLLVMGLGAISTAGQPVLARLYSQGDEKRLQRLMTAMSRLGLVFSVAAALPMILLGRFLLKVIFGRLYMGGAAALAILCLGRIVNAGTGALGPFLSMSRRARILAVGLGSEACLNVGLNILFIPRWGITGAAAATAGSMAISNIIMAVIIWKTTRYDVSCIGFVHRRNRLFGKRDNLGQ